MLPLPPSVKESLYETYQNAPNRLPAHHCKQLADDFRIRNKEPERNLIVFRGGSLARIFSDVEMAAIREAVKSCIAFRKGDAPMTVIRQEDGWLCGACNLFRFVPKESLPEGLSAEEHRLALQYLAFELLFRDALELHSVLLLVGDHFTNLEQKREFARTKRRTKASKSESSPADFARTEPEHAVEEQENADALLEQPSPLSVGGYVSHRIWGTGRLTERTLHARQAFWSVVFPDGEKRLSEQWLMSNCTIREPNG